MISGIMPKNDNLNEHAIKVNYISRKAYSKRNTGFIDNENLNPRYSCNRSKMDLNKKRNQFITENRRENKFCSHKVSFWLHLKTTPYFDGHV